MYIIYVKLEMFKIVFNKIFLINKNIHINMVFIS